MKVIVPIKAVAVLEGDDAFSSDGSAVQIDFVERELNDWDTFALEAALELKDGEPSWEVVAVTIGDDWAEEALAECLARGADRGVRIWGEDVKASDALSVARILASFVDKEEPDLILCGAQSADAANGATGVALAAALAYPYVAVVRSLEVDIASKTALVSRELEGGVREIVRVGLPTVLTIQTGMNQPRYATLRAIKRARDKPVAEFTTKDLGLDPEGVATMAGAEVRRLIAPDRGAAAEMLIGAPPEIASRIAEIIRERVG